MVKIFRFREDGFDEGVLEAAVNAWLRETGARLEDLKMSSAGGPEPSVLCTAIYTPAEAAEGGGCAPAGALVTIHATGAFASVSAGGRELPLGRPVEVPPGTCIEARGARGPANWFRSFDSSDRIGAGAAARIKAPAGACGEGAIYLGGPASGAFYYNITLMGACEWWEARAVPAPG